MTARFSFRSYPWAAKKAPLMLIHERGSRTRLAPRKPGVVEPEYEIGTREWKAAYARALLRSQQQALANHGILGNLGAGLANNPRGLGGNLGAGLANNPRSRSTFDSLMDASMPGMYKPGA